MALSMHTIQPKKGSKKTKKRIGRGLGSTGTYSGRGVKGQRARSGVGGLKLKGLRAIMLAQPKRRGFKSAKPTPDVVNVGMIDKAFKAGALVTPKALEKAGLVTNVGAGGVKVLGAGSIGIKVTVKGCKLSEAARKKITEAGGSVQE